MANPENEVWPADPELDSLSFVTITEHPDETIETIWDGCTSTQAIGMLVRALQYVLQDEDEE